MEDFKTPLRVVNSDVGHAAKAPLGAVACSQCHGEGYVRGIPSNDAILAASKERRRKKLQTRDRWAAVGWGLAYVSLVLSLPALCGMLVQVIIVAFWLIMNLAHFAATHTFLDFPPANVLGPPSIIGSVLGALLDLAIVSQVINVGQDLAKLWHQKDRRKPVDNLGLDE